MYLYTDEVLKIEQYTILDIVPCKENEYDIFDLKLNNDIKNKIINYKDGSNYTYTQLDEAQFLDLFLGNKGNKKYRDKKIYLYSRVMSNRSSEVVINITCLSRAKLWLNNKCMTVHNEEYYDPSFCVSAELRTGINDIVIELYINRDWGPLTVAIGKAGEVCNNGDVVDPIVYIHSASHYCPELDTFSIMCMTNNKYYKKRFNMRIVLSGDTVKSISASFNKRIDIDVSNLRRLCTDKLSPVNITCYISTLDGKIIALTIPRIIVNDFSNDANRIIDELIDRARFVDSEVLYHHIIGSIKEQEDEKTGGVMMNYFDCAVNNIALLKKLKTNSLSRDFYLEDNTNKLFIHSNLDDSYVKITLKMPIGYNSDRKYPAFISINLVHNGDFSYLLDADKLTEPCFSFDVTGRGVTGGSYIGEASIIEIVQWIIKHYNIDERRIYFLGKSSGGFAAYSIAQNYPDLPAAIFPLGGYPNVDSLKNITNIPTYQIVSKKDFVNKGRVNEVKQIIGSFGNYYQRVNNNYYHSDIIKHIADMEFLNAMLTNSRDDFPHRVIYKTYRNRHLRSFWIKLHGISRGCRCASIDASIESDGIIRISVKGSDGVTITLPPQINRNAFNIVINNRMLHFDNCLDNTLIFSRKGGWHVATNEPEADVIKGSGLLDVYMNALRIVIPDEANESILESAMAFSQPSSNGFVQHLHVEYPVFRESDMPARLTTNLIVFDNNNGNKCARAFEHFLTIKCDETGFEYKGKRYIGDYVVMQAIVNPYNRGRSVLVINANNSELLGRCLFTRRVVIPFYSNGFHPYLNNECLIFTGGKYYGVYERGADMKIID